MDRLTVRGRVFERGGKPFFWLGDTAWFLFAKLTDDERLVYLQNRAAKGFTVIQATLVHTRGMCDPSGSPALIGDDFLHPNRDPNGYWQGVRETVRQAEACGLVMALLPAWGSFVKDGSLNTQNAPEYARFLSEQFGSCNNVVWLLGGDIRGSVAPDTFDVLGNTLRRLCPGQLIGYHPFGRTSSSMYFHDRSWLDFNMFQSGHRDYSQRKLNAWDDANTEDYWFGEDNFLYALRDRALSPVKPTLDGEPSYELIPHGLHDGTKPYWQACDVRRYAYWSLLSGTAGHTYGDNAIMQFHREGDAGDYSPLQTWREALHNPGSMQMGHARRLMEMIDWYNGEPAQDLIAGDALREGYDQIRALITPTVACVYRYNGQPFSIRTDLLPYSALDSAWFDPVSGGFSYIGSVDKNASVRFMPPHRRSEQNDWVLLLWERGNLLTRHV